MFVEQILGAALLFAPGSDPIDRAHGAKPSNFSGQVVEQDESGLWSRMKDRWFAKKSKPESTPPVSRSNSPRTAARSGTGSTRQQKTVVSNVTLMELLGKRVSTSNDSKKPDAQKADAAPTQAPEDKRPILERLRTRLSWHREKPAAETREPRFAWFKKAAPAEQVSQSENRPELKPVPDSPAIVPITPAAAEVVRKNDPDRNRELMTRVDSNPRWSAPGAAAEKAPGSLSPLVVRDATLIVSPQALAAATRPAPDFVIVPADMPPSDVPASDVPLEPTQPADPTPSAPLAATLRETDALVPSDQAIDHTGPTLVDPNATSVTFNRQTESVQAASAHEHVLANRLANGSLEPETVAAHPEAGAAPSPTQIVEPANLELANQTPSATIDQTGFVHHATPKVAKRDSNPQPEERTTSAVTESPSSRTGLLSGILSPALCQRLNSLPTECYPIVGLLAGATFVLLFSRSRRAAPPVAVSNAPPIAAQLPGAFGLPVSMILPAMPPSNPGDEHAQARGSVFASLAVTVGLAIIAVGGVAVFRAVAEQQSTLMRPGVAIAAVGQFILLLGIVAMAVRSRRSVASRDGGGLLHARSAAAQPVVASALPYLSLGAGYAWPTPSPRGAGQSGQSGQIAQLKAQLACLSQQLDHLGGTATDAAGNTA
jgi:hypothetical protein